MKFAIHNHQNKGTKLMEALLRKGHKIDAGRPDFLLIDHDGTQYYRKIIDHYHDLGAKIVLYPHGATAFLRFDGVWPVNDKVSAYLAMSEGQAEILNRIGYPKEVHVTGWHWCEQLPFRPADLDRRLSILYAPVHPLTNGYIHPDVKAANAKTFNELICIPADLTVRYIGDLEAAGLWAVDGVRFVKGQADNDYADIDAADIVVSFGTFAYLSIARGCPTIIYRQHLPYMDGHCLGDTKVAQSPELYQDYLHYGYSGMYQSIKSTILYACKVQRTDWRIKFIGPQMTPERLETVCLNICT